MAKEKRSFFERLTGAVRVDEDVEEDEKATRLAVSRGKTGGAGVAMAKSGGLSRSGNASSESAATGDEWQEEQPEGQLTVDVYQTPADIIIQTMVAGVHPDDLDLSITRDMVTIRGKRETDRQTADEDYFFRELYWGSFSRTILLPQEIEVEEAEANEKHGLLTIRLPKIDKGRQTKLKVKSSN